MKNDSLKYVIPTYSRGYVRDVIATPNCGVAVEINKYWHRRDASAFAGRTVRKINSGLKLPRVGGSINRT